MKEENKDTCPPHHFEFVCEEILKEFDEAFNPPLMIKNQKTGDYSCAMCGIMPDAIKSFLSSTLTKAYQDIELAKKHSYDAGWEGGRTAQSEVLKEGIRKKIEELPDTYEDDESAVFRTTKEEILDLIK